MPKSSVIRRIESIILSIRGQRVILDADLATVYSVSTKRFNEQVRRNRNRFPDDFCFRLTKKEWDSVKGLRSHFATIEKHRGKHRKYLPYVFTEHGAIMAANVLRSRKAIQMSVFVVRAFVKMRGMLTNNKELAQSLEQLETKLRNRLDLHETAIVDVLRRIMDLIDPPPGPEPEKKRIGY